MERVREFTSLSLRLLYGVDAGGIALAMPRLPGLARGRIRMFMEAGWLTLEDLMAAPMDELRRLITHDVAERLMPMVHRYHRDRMADAARAVDPFDAFMPMLDEAPPEPWSATYPAADPYGFF